MSNTNRKQVVTPIKQSVVTKYVKRTNRVIGEIKTKHSKLFAVVLEAVGVLGEDKKALSSYKNQVEIEKSTFNKMLKIIKRDVILNNLDALPFSWASLYEIQKSFTDDKILDLLETKAICVNTTLKEIREIKQSFVVTTQFQKPQVVTATKVSVGGVVKSTQTSSQPVVQDSTYFNIITYDLNTVAKQHRLEVEGLLSRLQQLGFAITDLAEAA